MPSTPYRKGYFFEWYVKRKLDDKGYKTARSAGSHTEFDIYAILPYDKWLSRIRLGLALLGIDDHICEKVIELLKNNPPVVGVQCKKGGKLRKREKEAMVKSSEIYPLLPVLAYSTGKKVKFVNVKKDIEVDI